MNPNDNSINDGFYIIPRKELIKINGLLSQILEKIENQSNSKIHRNTEYVGEDEAKSLLNKKTTWFWQMRKSGKLQFSKVGNKNYYKISDLKKLLDDGYQNLVLNMP